MRIRSLAPILTGFALLVVLAAPASAQTVIRKPAPLSSNASSLANSPGPRLSADYTFFHFSDGNYPLGFLVDFSQPLTEGSKTPVSVVGQFGWHHASGDSFGSILGGARIGFAGSDNVAPFVQGLVGTTLSPGNFMIEFDGGADIRLNPKDKWCVRVAAGIPIIFETGGHSTSFQVSFGVSMNLGGS